MWDTSLRGPIRYVIWREVPHFSRSGVECEAHRFLISGRDRPRELLFDSTRKELKMEGKTEVTGQKNLGGFEDDNWFLPMLVRVYGGCCLSSKLFFSIVLFGGFGAAAVGRSS